MKPASGLRVGRFRERPRQAHGDTGSDWAAGKGWQLLAPFLHRGSQGEMTASANQPLPPPPSTPRPPHTTPSPQKNLPFATVAARNLPVCHSRATHSPHPGLPAHPRVGTETTGISEGRLQNRRAGGNTALEQEGRGLLGFGGTAAGVIPPRTMTVRDGRDNPVFNSRVSEPTPSKGDAGDGWVADAVMFHNCKWLVLPPPPPPPTFGVCLKYLDVDFVSPAHLQLKHSFLFTGPLPVTGSQSSEEAFIS